MGSERPRPSALLKDVTVNKTTTLIMKFNLTPIFAIVLAAIAPTLTGAVCCYYSEACFKKDLANGNILERRIYAEGRFIPTRRGVNVESGESLEDRAVCCCTAISYDECDTACVSRVVFLSERRVLKACLQI